MIIKGSIRSSEPLTSTDCIIKINNISGNCSTAQYSIEIPDTELYLLKIEAKGYYPAVQTFSHYELTALSLPKSTDNLSIPEITLVKHKNNRVMFAFGGDVMVGRRFLKPYFNEPQLVHEQSTLADIKLILQYTKPYLEIADFSSINLESQIAKNKPEQRAKKSVTFFSPPETLTALKWAGVDYVSLGNNHTYDYLEAGLSSTLSYLDESGLGYSGAGLNEDQALKAFHTTLAGQKYALLGYVGWKGGVKPNQVAEDAKGGAAFGNKDNIIKTVTEASNRKYHTIIQYHGSLEYSDEPSKVTESRLKTAIEKGADLVIAHHPHVTQGFEIYKDKLIAYSMGNFIFDQYFHAPPLSYMLYVWMDGDKFHRAEIIPIYLKGYSPIPATGIQRSTITKRVRYLSSKRGLDLSESGGHLVITNDESTNKSTQRKPSLKLQYSANSSVQDIYHFPVPKKLVSITSPQSNVQYRLGQNQLNGGDFETFNLFHSRERSWLLKNASLSKSQTASGSYSMKLTLNENNNATIGMKYFRRVFDAASPMTYKAKILNTSTPIKIKLFLQRRNKKDKLFSALKNNNKQLLDEQILQPGESWQNIEIDFNTPRVGYRSYRLLLEVTALDNQTLIHEQEQIVFIDDVALIEWQGHFNDVGTLPVDSSLLELVTHIGINKSHSNNNLFLNFN